MFIRGERKTASLKFAFVSMIMPVILTMACSGMDLSREAETKVNLHTIQEALNRYAVDHGGAYPEYILGGDLAGWDSESGCRAVTEAPSEDKSPPPDPLIEGGYMSSYPTNPFLSSRSALTFVVAKTGTSAEPGYGDVRFGLSGDIMGNCLDDPRYLFTKDGQATRYRYTMLPDIEANIGVLRVSGPNSFYCMGGTKGDNAWWPGEFFYRSGGDYFFSEHPHRISGPEYSTIWDWPYAKITHYMLGAYGPVTTDGIDVIRLTTKHYETAARRDGAITGRIEHEYYQSYDDPDIDQSHPDFVVRVDYSNPEVMGHGNRGIMPQFPYYQSGTNEWMFGAPDGYRDGIILVLTSDPNWRRIGR